MFDFNFIDVSFNFNQAAIEKWLLKIVESENKNLGEITYIFCNDEYLLGINQRYLEHDTYTDIITFDTTIGETIGADIFISSQRVAENAIQYKVSFEQELQRVIAHGILHLCGYKDKSESDAELMKSKEDEKIGLFHVER